MKKKMKIIQNLNEIPQGMTEVQEHEFWKTHGFSDTLLKPALQTIDDFELPAPRQAKASHPTSLRLDDDTTKRLKYLAHLKHLPYQSLLKTFVQERLYEEEKRMGII